MKYRKNNSTALIILMLLPLICILSSCDKVWTCNDSYAIILCTKGTDSIYVNTSLQPGAGYNGYLYSQSFYQNAVNYYKQNGYNIDTIGGGGGPVTLYNVETVKAYEANGVGCAQGSDL